MIKVLVVDDSAFMRKIFSENINSDPELTVIDTARNGKKALEKLESLNPDILTLDIEMPEMDGLTTLQKLNEKHPDLPVLMVSALDNRDTVMKALDMGAFDFIPKPSGSISLEIDDIADELLVKLKAGARAGSKTASASASAAAEKTTIQKKSPDREKKTVTSRRDEFPVVAIGASSGGPKAIKHIMMHLPPDFPAALAIVQHMPAGFTASLASRLDKETSLNVQEAESGDRLKPGSALLAPGDYHMEFEGIRARLNQKPKKWGVRPCADYMLSSLAESFGSRVIGVILTGMGSDGGEGMKMVKSRGGYGIIEDRSTALVYGMPESAIKKDAYDIILPRPKIPREITKIVERRLV